MNQFLPKNVLFALLLLISSLLAANAQTPVAKYGQLQIKNGKVSDKNGNPVVLRGMSLFWSGYSEGAPYYDASTVKWLRDDWCVDIIRVPMAVEQGESNKTYLSNPTYAYNQVKTVIDACIANGLYVIVDFHTHNAEDYKTEAKKFFTDIATEYGDKPNILYETFNEPIYQDWNSVIKPYHNELVQTIRAKDPNNIIICGTRLWSQEVDEAADNPVTGTNIAYTLHYYADSHKGELRQKVTYALNKGVAIFATEYGTCNANGAGNVNASESQTWWNFLEANQISSCNWSVTNKNETSAAITGTSAKSGWTESQLTTSGKLVRNYIKSKCNATVTTGTISLSFTGNKTQFNVGETVTINATATASNGSVNKVEFFRNGALISTDNSSPFSASFPASAALQGGHGITAKSYDAGGNLIAESSIYNITIVGDSDISTTGVTDQFETKDQFSELTGGVTGTNCATANAASAVGIYWWEANKTSFKAQLTRPGNGKLEYLLSKEANNYDVFGFSFGEYCDNGVKKKYAMDLRQNAVFSITVSTPSTNTVTLDLKFQMKDINGKTLAFNKSVVSDKSNSYKHDIGFSKDHTTPDFLSLSPNSSSNFTFNFKDAVTIKGHNYPADIENDNSSFDYSKVTEIIMIPVNAQANANHQPLAFTNQKIIFSGLKLGNPALGADFCTTPKAVTATDKTYCKDAVSTALTATGTSGLTLKWYTTASGGTAAPSALKPSTATVGTTNYYVSQAVPGSATCEGPRTNVKVIVTNPPSSNAGSDKNIGMATLTTLSGTGDQVGTWKLVSGPAGASVSFSPSANSASVTANGLSKAGDYKFSYTVGSGTCVSVSNMVVTVAGPTGTSDLVFENKVEIYPNPVSNNLNINMSKLSGSKSVKVVDMMGRIITEKSNEDMISVDMDNLPQGMYLIQIQTESGNMVKSVIKK
jgi:endoglucanase